MDGLLEKGRTWLPHADGRTPLSGSSMKMHLGNFPNVHIELASDWSLRAADMLDVTVLLDAKKPSTWQWYR